MILKTITRGSLGIDLFELQLDAWEPKHNLTKEENYIVEDENLIAMFFIMKTR
jgi:hypothetical protein